MKKLPLFFLGHHFDSNNSTTSRIQNIFQTWRVTTPPPHTQTHKNHAFAGDLWVHVRSQVGGQVTDWSILGFKDRPIDCGVYFHAGLKYGI